MNFDLQYRLRVGIIYVSGYMRVNVSGTVVNAGIYFHSSGTYTVLIFYRHCISYPNRRGDSVMFVF